MPIPSLFESLFDEVDMKKILDALDEGELDKDKSV